MNGSPREPELQETLAEEARALAVPGVAVGIHHHGEQQYAFHGVASVENPLVVDAGTLFQFGSTGKTFTATAIMRLVEQGKVDLDERVRTYLPEFALKDEQAAQDVRILHLLNHSAGWQGDFFADTGEGDDALTRFVGMMAGLEQDFPPGRTVSYNDCALSVAGLVIERVTGKTYEHAIRELLLDPLGLHDTLMFPNEIMTRGFAVGHQQHEDGSITVARPWMFPRSATPGGGLSATARDQITWAQFHLGDGRAADGTRVLSQELLDHMKEPTIEAHGVLGDYIGIIWRLTDADGVRIVGHGGTTNGQHSAFETVPEHDFAITVLTNCGPNGDALNERLVRWAFAEYLGITIRDPEPVERPEATLTEYVGTYESVAWTFHVELVGGGLQVRLEIKPEVLATLFDETEDLDLPGPMRLGMLSGSGDTFIALDGPYQGDRGLFTRSDSGAVDGFHFGGRLAPRSDFGP